MTKRNFLTEEELACEIMDYYYVADNDTSIGVYGKYEEIKNLFEILITKGVPISLIVELEDYEVSHYDKEYALFVSAFGVSVEKMYGQQGKNNDGYINSGATVHYVHEDCSSKLLGHLIDGKVIEFKFGEDEDVEYFTEWDEDGDITGFTVRRTDEDGYRSYSYYTSKNIDEDEIRGLMDLIKY